jgi:hypothetical protein
MVTIWKVLKKLVKPMKHSAAPVVPVVTITSTNLFSSSATEEVVVVPDPLAIMPTYEGVIASSSIAAPHLPTCIAQAIGIEFLKMHPQDVSTTVLLASDDD